MLNACPPPPQDIACRAERRGEARGTREEGVQARRGHRGCSVCAHYLLWGRDKEKREAQTQAGGTEVVGQGPDRLEVGAEGSSEGEDAQ